MDKNASSADDPRDGVIDVERLEESWWPPAAHTFPTPKGLNGADWRALRTAGELGAGETAAAADTTATTVAEVLVAERDEPARPRRIGWVAAIVPIVVVGGIVGLAIGGSSDDASRSALGGVPVPSEVTTATTTTPTSTAATSSTATSGAPTTATAATTATATTATPVTTVAPTTAATATTPAPTTAPPGTTATTAARPPVTLASPGDAKALDDLDIAGLNWWGELRDSTIFLRGRIPTVAARDVVIANAKDRAGDVRVVEQLVVDPSITATRPLGDVPLIFTDRVYFTGTSTTIGSDYLNLVRFAQFTLNYQQGVSLAVVVRTPDDTEGTSLARARADTVVEAVVKDGIDRSRVSVSTTRGLGNAATNDELARRDAAALLVVYGFFTAPPA